MNKKNIFLWSLYDFANSIVMIVFFLYFAQWLVVEKGVSDAWYNFLFIFATILLILTAPVASMLADKTGRCFEFLKWNTVIVWILYLLLTALVLFYPEQIILAMILFVFGNFTYQLSFAFYTPLLNELAPEDKRGKISGIGNASNWLGEIVGLLLALPFAGGTIYLFGTEGRAQAFLPATVVFILLSLPMLLFYKREKINTGVKITTQAIKKEYKNIFKEMRSLFILPGVSMFMIAFFFFNDAILTASNNFPIVLERVFGATDEKKTLLLALILITSVFGSLAFGWLGDRFGLKRVLLWILGGWVIIFPLIGMSKDITTLTTFVTLMGLLFGGVWAVSRAMLSQIIPPDRLNHAFSFYVLSERFASFLGPLAWSGIVVFAPTENGLNYRIAMVSMTVFIIIGFILMRKVEYKK